MTPERALEHDDRCERSTISVRDPVFERVERIPVGAVTVCRCLERALTAARAEVDRLTRAASESARTLETHLLEKDAEIARLTRVVDAAGAFCYELAHGRLWPWLNLSDVQRQKIQVVADELSAHPPDAA